ncbi:MAG: chemotaxis protein CheB, partial [Bacteroidota bacterium]
MEKTRAADILATSPSQAVQPDYVVAVGASAGGLEALIEMFKHIPADCQFTFLVMQHYPADQESHIVEILKRETGLETSFAQEGQQLIYGQIYIAPAGQEMRLIDGKLHLRQPEIQKHFHYPIDSLFQSVGEACNENSVGIILSGTGSDGSRGLKVIKERGGLVIIQDPDSARFDGMPRAAMAGSQADFLIRPDQISQRLMVYFYIRMRAFEDQDAQDLNEDIFVQVIERLGKETGIDYAQYKQAPLRRRIYRRMKVHQCDNLFKYLNLLYQDPNELDLLNKEILISVSQFFREPDAWHELEQHIIPNIFAEAVNQEVRIWVPGCASGEEVYTLAILLSEHAAALDKNFSIKIFATGVNTDALAIAGRGIYPNNILKDVPAKYL